MNNLQFIIKDDSRYAMHVAVELCEQGDFDSVTEAFKWLMQERGETTLLRCPFCGGEANVIDHHNDDGSVSVGCNNDTCLGFSGLGWLYKTEAEAIAAWNTRAMYGTLTAEQVEKVTYAHSIHADCADADWQAIADELNAELGSGMCEYKPMWNDDDLLTGEYVGMWYTGCGDALVWNADNDECCKPPAFCPYCGGAVKVVSA